MSLPRQVIRHVLPATQEQADRNLESSRINLILCAERVNMGSSQRSLVGRALAFGLEVPSGLVHPHQSRCFVILCWSCDHGIRLKCLGTLKRSDFLWLRK